MVKSKGMCVYECMAMEKARMLNWLHSREEEEIDMWVRVKCDKIWNWQDEGKLNMCKKKLERSMTFVGGSKKFNNNTWEICRWQTHSNVLNDSKKIFMIFTPFSYLHFFFSLILSHATHTTILTFLHAYS